MNLIKNTIYLLLITGAILSGALILSGKSDALSIRPVENFLAGVFFIDSITETEMKDTYKLAEKEKDKLNILIVPGHDDDVFGAQFKGIKEADLNIELAEYLKNFFEKEKEFDVFLVRNKYGYNSIFSNYFNKNKDSIIQFISQYKNMMNTVVQIGLVEINNTVEHNSASEKTIIKLYGINKWANENDIDIVINIHFNDYPGRRYDKSGEYSGFAIYIPEKQFSNSKASMALAKPVFDQLKKYLPVSDMPKEQNSIIEDQELIAIGANNSLDSAVLFIEYGYIYESQFINENIRKVALEEAAYQTYLGIKNFFEGENNPLTLQYDTLNNSYSWNDNLNKGLKGNKDVFALQLALAQSEIYPPKMLSKNECPINGNFGKCTDEAVKEFQRKYNIEPPLGLVGPITRQKLNEIFTK
ncbi:MAG: N-acetylmuramoyl-L-alanine amidase [Parcubacteria group bacterium]|nr:N-acetylmuramoyl-L-alanine amidase [Parcubacteria group bacterium]MCR4342778.1 N-acetylmuramoyl-L-alanine amidase [Patescibacteria group bacterium]